MNFDYKIDNYKDLYYKGGVFRQEDKDLKEVFGFVKEGQKIIDLGCANGNMIDVFDFDKKQYIGVDINKDLINDGKSLHKGFTFINKAITEIKDKVDYVLAFYGVMNYLNNDDLEHIKNISRRGYVLMDYKDGYRPLCYGLNQYPVRRFDKEKYYQDYIGVFNNYKVYSNLDIKIPEWK